MSDVKERNSENNSSTALTPKKAFKPKFPSLWIFGKAEGDRNELNSTDSLFDPFENQVLENGGDEVKASPGSGLNFGVHDSTDYGALAEGDSPPLYYGVSLPSGSGSADDSEEPLVFTDKKEALRFVKKCKGARFKVFQNVEDAVAFASLPADEICPTPTSKSASVEVAESEKIQDALVLKPDPFRGPKSQDIVKLRKAIESGDKNYFVDTVWSNPRYLISGCDTPTIMQEGFRYNGLHVAAKHKQPEMCRLILGTIEDQSFIELLYSEDTESCRADRQRYVLDLYLNTPDKGLYETPLHFASKFGCLEAVEILAFHPCCDKKRKNKYGLQAKEIICERCPSASPELKKKIEAIFEEHYFVPVYRSSDDSVQPFVGEPYSLRDPRTPYENSPVINPTSPRDASLAVAAVAGPLSPEDASDLYQQWKMPSCTVFTQEASMMNRIRLSDPDKGLERIGRYLAQSVKKTSWIEYWTWLKDWCDLASEDGLQRLEEHLKMNYIISNLSKKLPLGVEQGQRTGKWLPLSSSFQPNGDFNSGPVLMKSADSSNISSSSSSSSGISSLCQRLEDLNLSDSDNSLLKTSPDMPKVLKSHGDPFQQGESPLNSPNGESCIEGFPIQSSTPDNECFGDNNPNLWLGRLNLSFTKEQEEDIASSEYVSYRKWRREKKWRNERLSNCAPGCISDGVNGPNVYVLVRIIVQVFSDLVTNPDTSEMPQTTLHKFLTEIVLPHVKCLYESVSESSCQKETVHCDIAMKVYKRMQLLSFIFNIQQVKRYLAAYLESKFSTVSLDDESDNRKHEFTEPRCLSTSRNTMWKHLMCILVFLNTFLSNKVCISDISVTACQCVWQDDENLPKVEVNKQLELEKENSAGSSLSSDEDYVTPPTSPTGFSSPEEPGTPEEGLEVYVEGTVPSKTDADVLRVVENVHVDPVRFPHVFQWKHLMSSYDKQVIESWPSPSRRKFHEDVVCAKSRTPYRSSAMSPSSEISDLSRAFTPVRSKAEVRPSFRKTLSCKSLYEKFLAVEEK